MSPDNARPTTIATAVVAATTAAFVVWAALALYGPGPLASGPFAEASARADREARLLLVKATADWCAPCKAMEETTFRDERVLAWLAEHAVFLTVDVDEQPALAAKLRITAMPTLMLFRHGQELDRAVGFRDPDELLAWLDAASSNQPPGTGPPPMDIQARLQHARHLADTGKTDRAIGEFVWLWRHMLDREPAMKGVRVSFMAGDMHDLAARSPKAREAFETLRAEALADMAARAAGGPGTRHLRDWLVLSERVLDDRAAVLAWVDELADAPDARAVFCRVDDVVTPALVEESRWATLGALIDEPIASLKISATLLQHEPAPTRHTSADEYAEMHARMFREDAAQTHAALLAAGRDAEAWEAADFAIETLDTPATRADLVRVASEAGALRPRHADLLTPDAPGHKRLIKLVRQRTKD